MSIFNDSKYTRWYNNIVESAKQRTLTDIYTELHHIVPKSLKGNDMPDNLVRLTAREHFLCHWLLTKMTSGPDQIKMGFAFNAFRRSSRNQERYLTSHRYEIVRQEVSKARSLFLKGNKFNLGKKRGPLSEETKQKISQAKMGKITSESTRIKQSNALKGKSKSEETKQRMRKPKSKEHAENIRRANLGKKLSEETKKKISEAKRSKKEAPF